MRIAICDDDKKYAAEFEEGLCDVLNLEYECITYSNGEDLIQAHKADGFDVIFLDMEIGKLSGIDTANAIRTEDKHVIIVFITSYPHYMQKSFECMPFRFLIKPILADDIKEVMEKVIIKLTEERKTLVFTENRNTVRLFCEDIIYIESASHRAILHTKDRVYKIYKALSEIYRVIDKTMFVKTHGAYIVNLGYIRTIGRTDIDLYCCDDIIPVSRANKKTVEARLFDFKERKYLL